MNKVFTQSRVKRRGFTLLELLIGFVLIGISLSASIQLFTGQNRSARYIAAISDTSRVSDNLKLVFRNEQTCAGAFKNENDLSLFSPTASPYANVASSPTSISLGGAKVLELNQNLGDTKINSISIFQKSPPIQTQVAPNQYTYSVEVRINAAPTLAGMTKFNRSLSYLLDVKTEDTALGQKILTCSGGELNSSSSSNSASAPDLEDVCVSFVGGSWNDTLQKCHLIEPRNGSDPSSPLDGQMWLRTDL